MTKQEAYEVLIAAVGDEWGLNDKNDARRYATVETIKEEIARVTAHGCVPWGG